MINLDEKGRYRVVPGNNDLPTILDITDPQRPLRLTEGNDVAALLDRHMQQAMRLLGNARPVALFSIGDGYLINGLARYKPNLLLDQEVSVFLIEPDIELLATCLTVHDYTGPQGPIEQQRIKWFVGKCWAESFAHLIQNDPMQPPPGGAFCLSRTGHQLAPIVAEIGLASTQATKKLEQDVRTRSVNRGVEHHLKAMRGELDRRPRVLIPTSRFTTVLQYASRDVAKAFQSLGWDTHIVIEDRNDQAVNQKTVLHLLDSYDPDLVFSIDHLRSESEIFPPSYLTSAGFRTTSPTFWTPKRGKPWDLTTLS